MGAQMIARPSQPTYIVAENYAQAKSWIDQHNLPRNAFQFIACAHDTYAILGRVAVILLEGWKRHPDSPAILERLRIWSQNGSRIVEIPDYAKLSRDLMRLVECYESALAQCALADKSTDYEANEPRPQDPAKALASDVHTDMDDPRWMTPRMVAVAAFLTCGRGDALKSHGYDLDADFVEEEVSEEKAREARARVAREEEVV